MDMRALQLEESRQRRPLQGLREIASCAFGVFSLRTDADVCARVLRTQADTALRTGGKRKPDERDAAAAPVSDSDGECLLLALVSALTRVACLSRQITR